MDTPLSSGQPTFRTINWRLRARKLYAAYALYYEFLMSFCVVLWAIAFPVFAVLLALVPIADLLLPALGIKTIAIPGLELDTQLGQITWREFREFALITFTVGAAGFVILPAARGIVQRARLDDLGAIVLIIALTTITVATGFATRGDELNQTPAWFVGEQGLDDGLLVTGLVLICLALIHLCAAMFVRAFRDARFAARITTAPLFTQYRLFWRARTNNRHSSLAYIISNAKSYIVRVTTFTIGATTLLACARGSVHLLPKQILETELSSVMAIILIAPAIIYTLLDMVRRPHVRGLNVLMILFLLDKVFLISFQFMSFEDTTTIHLLVSMGVVFREWLFAPARNFMGVVRKASVRSAEDEISGRSHHPILFLRSFRDDRLDLTASQKLFDFFLGGTSENPRLEEVATEVLAPVGPVVTFSNLTEMQREILGAARLAVHDTDWRQRVSSLIDVSQLIVVVAGNTPSLAWELDEIARLDALSRTLVIVPPSVVSPIKLRFGAEQLAIEATAQTASSSSACGVRVLFRPSDTDRWTGLTAVECSQSSYAEAIRVAAGQLLQRRCRPLGENVSR